MPRPASPPPRGAPARGAPAATRLGLTGVACLMGLAGLVPRPLSAQAAPPDSAARRAVVDTLAALAERVYVSADTGRMIAERLRAHLRDGTYARAARWRDLTNALTTDLRAVNGDTHLWVELARPGDRPPPPRDETERRANYFIERVDRLAGDVGYLRLGGFAGTAGAFAAVAGALRALEGTDAVVLDLRNAQGGSAQMANFLVSHFTGPDTVPTVTAYDRLRGDTVRRYTAARVPGPRRPDVPLYVLVDRITRSAAEDVPFTLQNLGRARVVGERTAGAGHNNVVVPVGNGLEASFSVTRVVDPRSGREWERVGVRPDVPAPPARALEVAHLAALDQLAARGAAAGDSLRARALRLTREVVAAQYAHEARAEASVGGGDGNPGAALAALGALAGDYGGGGLVTRDGTRLYHQPRRALPRREMVRLGALRYGVDATRFAFDGGRAPRLRVTAADGTTAVYERQADGADVAPPQPPRP